MRERTLATLLFTLLSGASAVAGSFQIDCERTHDPTLKQQCLLEIQAMERARALGDRTWDEWVALDEALKAKIKTAMKAIAWDDASLDRIPSVTYLTPVYIDSGHEYIQLLTPQKQGGPLVGNIHLFEGARFDVWLARHRFSENRSLITAVGFMVVDKQSSPKKAYLFSAVPEAIKKGRLPPVIPLIENCLMCHASGGRLIRTADPMTAAMGERIQSLNRKMLAYGKVETNLGGKHFLPPLPASAFEPLQVRACIDCHSEGSPIRGPLRRLHMNEILFMVTRESAREGQVVRRPPQSYKALMPMERHALSENEIRCLRGWLSQTQQAGCTDKGEPVQDRKVARTYLLEAPYSVLHAEAISTYSKIPLDGFRISGSLDCEDRSCQGEVRAELQRITTGIGLRDKHLKEKYLSVSEHPLATATLEPFQIPGDIAIQAGIELKGITNRYAAKLHCTESDRLVCELSGLKLVLDRHGIAPPSFLGVKVESEVSVSGTLVFRQPVRTLATEPLRQASY